MSLLHLPPDILRLLSFNLSIEEISRLSRVSKHFHRVLWKSDHFWWQLVTRLLTQHLKRLISLRYYHDNPRDLFQDLIEGGDLEDQFKIAAREGYEIYIANHYDRSYDLEYPDNLISNIIQNGYIDIYKYFVTTCTDTIGDHSEFLMSAVLSKDLEIVKYLVESSKRDEFFLDRFRNAFEIGLRFLSIDHQNILEYLLSVEPLLLGINSINTVFMKSALCGFSCNVKFLIKKGIRPPPDIIKVMIEDHEHTYHPVVLTYLIDEEGYTVPSSIENVSPRNQHLILYLEKRMPLMP